LNLFIELLWSSILGIFIAQYFKVKPTPLVLNMKVVSQARCLNYTHLTRSLSQTGQQALATNG